MKEFKFKVLQNGDTLYSFSSTEMIIKEEGGNFRVYKIFDFDTGTPKFSKEFKTISINNLGSTFNDSVVVVKKSEITVIYKIDSFKKKMPILNHDFVILISEGVGKIEKFDPATKIKIILPAQKED